MSELEVSRKFQAEKGARLLRSTLATFKPELLRPFSQDGGTRTVDRNRRVQELKDLRHSIQGELRLLPTEESTPFPTSNERGVEAYREVNGLAAPVSGTAVGSMGSGGSRSSASGEVPNLALSDIEVVSLLSFSNHYDFWLNCRRPEKPGQTTKVCSELYRIEYGGDRVPEFPELCYALGHLILTGEFGHHGSGKLFTPSWFVAVVDLVTPQKPVWLVQDLYNLGWCASYGDDIDGGKERDPDPIDARDMDQLYCPTAEPGACEGAAEAFFEKLHGDKVDMIQLFPSLQAWEDAAKDPAGLVQRMLAKEKGCRYKRAKPRMHRATVEWLATSPTTAEHQV